MTSFMKPSPHLLVPLFGKNYWKKVYLTDLDNLILYHRMNEASGGTANDRSPEGNDGAYTGVTLGETGIGDGLTCPLFDGANDFNNLYSAAFNTDFSGAEGTAAIWAKVSGAGVWTDAATRQFFYLYVDGNNQIFVNKQAVDNRIQFVYKANGTTEFQNKDGLSETGWMHLAITWSAAADEVKYYYGGSQEGATDTVLGAWAGNLNPTRTLAGADTTTPTNVWDGWLAHVAIWKAALSPTQIAKLAAV